MHVRIWIVNRVDWWRKEANAKWETTEAAIVRIFEAFHSLVAEISGKAVEKLK